MVQGRISSVHKNSSMEDTQNSAVKEFCSSTSMHGCAHLISGSSYKIKLLWICVIMIASFGTVFHLYSQINLYFQYDFYESIHKGSGLLEFPDISVCGIEAWSQYTLYKNPTFAAKSFYDIAKFLATLKDEHFQTVTQRFIFASSLMRNEGTFANTGKTNISKLGISSEELILDCKYKGRPCSEVGEFIPFQHYQYFNCYTFRFNLSQNEDKNQIDIGPENGISIILKGNDNANFVYDTETISANVNGLKIAIHERGTLPPILNRGIDITPGTSTNIGLSMKKHARLNAPYGKCRAKDMKITNGFVYSELLCDQFSKSERVQDMCKCKSVKYYREDDEIKENCFYFQPGMDTNDYLKQRIENVFCELETTFQMDNNAADQCVWPCEETTYEFTMSQAEWPLEVSIKDFIQKYISPLPCESQVKWFYQKIQNLYGMNESWKACLTDTTSDFEKRFTMVQLQDALAQAMNGTFRDYFTNASFEMALDPLVSFATLDEAEKKWIQKYFYRLNVYFTESKTEICKQVISYSFTDLLSSVGGILGLWIGISVVTVVEMVVLVGKLFKPISGNKSMANMKSKVDVVK